jgi:hypothetical protein
MLPVPVAVVVVLPDPSPKTKFLNTHPVAPPKLPAPSSIKVPPVKFIVPSPVTSPPLTEILSVTESVPAVMVRSPANTVRLVNDHIPPEPLNNILLKSLSPLLMVFPESVALKVMLPLEWVKVPALLKFPPMVSIPLFEAIKVAPYAMVKSLATVIAGSLVVALTVPPLTVKLLPMLNVPPLANVYVGVPDAGLKLKL